ncbi:hypothetical protein NDU88_004634 [Pleurodeles waltl]|uniref:Uncharacterized protein n=1 Tax=Pleurodeles waltl TaxID=8319 RepID=A0AAV7RK52_PLEWA|nr:hypothetical protein NDU88_004634 [Pleurodeles waltl]
MAGAWSGHDQRWPPRRRAPLGSGPRGKGGGAGGAPRAPQPSLDQAQGRGSTGEPQVWEEDTRSPLSDRGERRTRLRPAAGRVHRLGPKRQDGKGRPRPIIACLLRHGQARQLLQPARTQGPLRLGTLEIRLSADFSKETADRRRAFLSLRPRLRHLDVKFGLFDVDH